MDIEQFTKMPGLLKEQMLKTNPGDAIKIDRRYYAFEKTDLIILVKWNDDKTLVFHYDKDDMILRLYHTGRLIKKFYWKNDESSTTLWTACLEFATAQESLANKHPEYYKI